MNTIKALKEKRNSLYDQVDEIRSTGSVEELGKVFDEIQELNKQIDGGEQRDKGVKVEVRNEQQKQTDKEQRGFDQFLRGEEGVEKRELQVTSDGAATVPEHVSDQLVLKMNEISPFFEQATRFGSTSGSLKIPREKSTDIGHFVSEGMDLPIDNLDLTYASLEQKRVGNSLVLTNQLISDSSIDLISYSINKLGRGIAKAVEKSSLVGTGGEQFNGLVHDEEVEAVTVSDVADLDTIVEMQTGIHPEFLDGAAFYLSRPFFNEVSKWKDKEAHYYLQNGQVNGKLHYTLLGMPVFISDALTAENPAVFANVKAAYAIMIKDGFNVIDVMDSTNALRGSRMFVMDAYMDGNVINPQAAIKLEVTA